MFYGDQTMKKKQQNLMLMAHLRTKTDYLLPPIVASRVSWLIGG